jgi:hypothetical protein
MHWGGGAAARATGRGGQAFLGFAYQARILRLDPL